MKSVKKWGTIAVAAFVAATAATVSATSAGAAPTVPSQNITNDPNAANGSVTFYDAAGKVVNSGTSLSHLFDYAEASTTATRSGSTKATLFLAFPDHNQTDSQNWVEQQQSSSTNYPNSGAPAPLGSSTRPVVTLTGSNANYTAAANGVTLDTTSGYAGIVQVRVYDSGPGVAKEAPFWASDIAVDSVHGTWQQVYPAVSGPITTATSLSASPASTTTGKTTTLTATVSPAAGGSVEFFDGTTSLGSKDVTSSTGTASLTTAALTAGTHSYTAKFTPSDSAAYATSTSSAVSVEVTAPAPDRSSLSISASTTIAYGRTTRITGTLRDTTTAKAIASAAVTIYVRHSATAAWTKSSTVHSAATGAVALTVKPTSTTYYQWRYAGSSTHAAATSVAAKVSVAQTATIHATPTKVTHGRSIKVWGGVAPSASARKVTLQKKVGAVYRTVVATTTKKQKLPNGSTAIGYVFTVKLAAKGTFSYRVVVSATSALSAGTSAAVTVRAV